MSALWCLRRVEMHGRGKLCKAWSEWKLSVNLFPGPDSKRNILPSPRFLIVDAKLIISGENLIPLESFAPKLWRHQSITKYGMILCVDFKAWISLLANITNPKLHLAIHKHVSLKLLFRNYISQRTHAPMFCFVLDTESRAHSESFGWFHIGCCHQRSWKFHKVSEWTARSLPWYASWGDMD